MKNPTILYGTAWKKDRTRNLVHTALQAGFRGIDTANQPKHYNEVQVGEGLQAWYRGGGQREDLFLQTKFTPAGGQDHRMPYNPRSPLHTQVRDSFASSQEHLNSEVIDAYLLHGPHSRFEWAQEDWIVWRTLEDLHSQGLAKRIGVSNVHIGHLKTLCEGASIKPHIVQNRCFAQLEWDHDVRFFCREHSIIYQGFSILTANPHVWNHSETKKLAEAYKKTSAQILLRFASMIGMVPLTGTTQRQHMSDDLGLDFDLNPEEIKALELSWAQ